jgi:hypothetical protein
MHLRVTEVEIKYMWTSNCNIGYSTAHIKIGSYTFERVHSLSIWDGD